jgi:ABC-type multidrug transport system fused ATPase/permease subunit
MGMFDRYAKLLTFIAKYRALCLIMLLSVVATTALRVYIPILLGNAVNIIVGKQTLGTVLTISLEIIAVSALSAAFQYGLGYGGQALGQRVIYDLRNKIFVALQNQSFSFHDRNETGQLMSRATGDVEAVRRLLAFGSSQILGNTFLMVGVVVELFFLNLYSGIIVTLTLPLVFYISWKYSQSQAPHWKLAREHYGTINSVLQQNITGMKVVRSFSAEDSEISKFDVQNEKYRDDIVNAARVRSFYSPLLVIIINFDTLLIYLLLGQGIVNGSIQVGLLVSVAGLVALIVGPVRFLGQLILFVQNGMAGFDRILEITESQVEIVDRSPAIVLDKKNVRGEICFEEVTFGYQGKGGQVLKGVNLKIVPGERVAFLGASGSGKTTAANLVPRFYDVSSGRVLLDGTDVRDIKLESLRSQIGIVSQDIFLFSATIRDNIAYGKSTATLEEVKEAARIAHADEFIERYPEKYDTLVGERGITLSGGQKQRVAIARTILTDPKVLILDDSLSSVDVETEFAIQDALQAVVAKRTTIIITQRLSTLRLADRIVVFDHGMIVEDGTHSELIQLGGVYSELYHAQLAPQSPGSEEILVEQPVRDTMDGGRKKVL